MGKSTVGVGRKREEVKTQWLEVLILPFYSASHVPFQMGATQPSISRGSTHNHGSYALYTDSIISWPLVRLFIHEYSNLLEGCGEGRSTFFFLSYIS